MEACEPRVRRRGFFLHSDTAGEPDTGERENPEGLVIRVGMARRSTPRQMASVSTHALSDSPPGSGRSRPSPDRADEGLPEIRSGSVTGSRQRAHLPR